MVLEAAVNGRADAIVTFNRADFGGVPIALGIEVVGPGDILRRGRWAMDRDVMVHLPHSLTDVAERVAREGGTTLDAFVASAVAEKLSAMSAAAFLAERGRRADLDAFDRFMNRPNGLPPAPEDRLND